MAGSGQAGATPIVSDTKIKAKTGSDWAQWYARLDKAGASKLDHQSIVALVRGRMGGGPWWGQMITVSYERARGVRLANQTRDGAFSVSVTKIMPISVSKLFALATDTRRRKDWFPPGKFEATSKTKNKYWRGAWRKGGRLEIGFSAKAPAKSLIAIQSSNLSGSALVERERAEWKKALDRLEALIK